VANGETQPATETAVTFLFSLLSSRSCLSLAGNRGRSPSLFRVYLMWIAPRTAVARDSVPPGRPGPIRNFAGCIGRGSESWRRWHVWPVAGSPLESLGFRIALCVVDPSVIATSTIGIQTGMGGCICKIGKYKAEGYSRIVRRQCALSLNDSNDSNISLLS